MQRKSTVNEIEVLSKLKPMYQTDLPTPFIDNAKLFYQRSMESATLREKTKQNVNEIKARAKEGNVIIISDYSEEEEVSEFSSSVS